MVQIFKEGDKSKALCSKCKEKVTTTFKVRNATIHDGEESFKVPNILVAVCDECDQTVSIPQQSFLAVGEVRKKSQKDTLDFRLPRHLLDIINASISALGVETSSDLRGLLVRLYVALLSEDKKQTGNLSQNLKSELLSGTFKRSSRLSLKISSIMNEKFEEIKKVSGLRQTEVIDSIIIEMKNDLLEGKNPKRFGEIRRAIMAGG